MKLRVLEKDIDEMYQAVGDKRRIGRNAVQEVANISTVLVESLKREIANCFIDLRLKILNIEVSSVCPTKETKYLPPAHVRCRQINTHSENNLDSNH